MKERRFGIDYVCSVKSSEAGSRRYHIQYAAVSATKTPQLVESFWTGRLAGRAFEDTIVHNAESNGILSAM